MVRSKVRYELIADERTRRESFKKRKAGFFKKLDELKTLCNAEVCSVLINEDGTQSDVWPSANEANQVIQRFNNLPMSAQTGHMVDQAGFVRLNLARITRNLDKENLRLESLEKEIVFVNCLAAQNADAVATGDLVEMLGLLETKMELVDLKIAEVEMPSNSRNAE